MAKVYKLLATESNKFSSNLMIVRTATERGEWENEKKKKAMSLMARLACRLSQVEG